MTEYIDWRKEKKKEKRKNRKDEFDSSILAKKNLKKKEPTEGKSTLMVSYADKKPEYVGPPISGDDFNIPPDQMEIDRERMKNMTDDEKFAYRKMQYKAKMKALGF